MYRGPEIQLEQRQLVARGLDRSAELVDHVGQDIGAFATALFMVPDYRTTIVANSYAEVPVPHDALAASDTFEFQPDEQPQLATVYHLGAVSAAEFARYQETLGGQIQQVA